MADPWGWQKQKYGRRGGASGGMSLGTGGGNIGIADYLSENFDNLGGGSLTPQQELTATNDAIRGGAAMKSPETDVTRFITEAPDGSNYMDPKPAEIPPMLARQITDPTPPAPAKGSGIDPNMLVRSQGDAQSRGSNLANPRPRREDFRQNELMAAKLEERANKALSGGWMGFAPDHTTASATRQLELANALRGRDEAKYQASLNQYYMLNPDKFEEWQRSAVIQKGNPVRYQSTNATERATGDMIQYSEAGTALRRPGVSETQLVSNEQITDRQTAADKRKARDREDEQAFDEMMEGTKHGNRMAQLRTSTAPQNKANELREKRDAGGGGAKPEAVDYADDEDEKFATKGGVAPDSPTYNSRMQKRGFVLKNVGTDEAPVMAWVRWKKLPAQGGATQAAPATGAKGAAPATEWKRDANGKPIPAGR